MWRSGAITVAIATGLLPGTVAAQNGGKLSLSGTTRLRYEVIDGQPRAGFNRSDDLFNLRTVLSAEWRSSPVKLAVELWDSRAYLADSGTPLSANEVNALELVQAYAEVPLSARARVTVGRFLLNLGSRRLVAADDYRNTTNAYTGLRVDLGGPRSWRGTAVYVLPQVRLPDDGEALRANRVKGDRESLDLVLWGGVVSRAAALGPATLEASFFHLGERDAPGRPTRDRSLNTAALRVMREPAPGRTDVDVELAVQRGRAAAGLAQNAARLPVRAWFLHAELSHGFAGWGRSRIAIEYDHASGDRPGGRYGRFDTLFGMRRAELAPAGLYNAVGRANLISPGARVEVEPARGTDAFVGYRALWLASRTDAFSTTGVRDASGASGRFAGHQIDVRVRHELARWARLELDALLLAKGRFLREAPDAPPGRWTRYLSLNATFGFR